MKMPIKQTRLLEPTNLQRAQWAKDALAVFTAEDDADSLGHRHRLAHGAGRVNPVSASVH